MRKLKSLITRATTGHIEYFHVWSSLNIIIINMTTIKLQKVKRKRTKHRSNQWLPESLGKKCYSTEHLTVAHPQKKYVNHDPDQWSDGQYSMNWHLMSSN